MFKTKQQVEDYVNEETDVDVHMADLKCSLDCLSECETMRDAKVNAIEALKSCDAIRQDLLRIVAEFG